MSELVETDACKGCRATVRLAPGEVDRILATYLADHPGVAVVDDACYVGRLMICDECPDLIYGTTCRHCGCLVAVRAMLAEKSCPGPVEKWQAFSPQ